jgi:hypothetical protein
MARIEAVPVPLIGRSSAQIRAIGNAEALVQLFFLCSILCGMRTREGMFMQHPDGQFLRETGGALADMADGNANHVFLYVEVGEGWSRPSAYREEGEAVRNLDFDGDTLFDLLWKAWRAEPKERRWSVMEYDLERGEFAVAFKYPVEVDVEVFDDARVDAALPARGEPGASCRAAGADMVRRRCVSATQVSRRWRARVAKPQRHGRVAGASVARWCRVAVACPARRWRIAGASSAQTRRFRVKTRYRVNFVNQRG